MSGGRFSYADSTLMNEMFNVGWGESDEKYTDELGDPMGDRELSELVFDVLNLIHDRDWFASGDTEEKDYNKSVRKFRKKWFDTPREDRLKSIVERMCEENRKECLKLLK